MRDRTRRILFLGILAALASPIALAAWADESTKPLAGTWKLTGWTLSVVGEIKSHLVPIRKEGL